MLEQSLHNHQWVVDAHEATFQNKLIEGRLLGASELKQHAWNLGHLKHRRVPTQLAPKLLLFGERMVLTQAKPAAKSSYHQRHLK